MTTEKNKFITTWIDLGVDYENWRTDPKDFCEKVAKRARELAIDLEKANTVMSNEESFKAQAYKDKEAIAAAEEIINNLMDILVASSPEVIANVMIRMPQVTSFGHTTIRTMAMRKTRTYTKKRTHAMYVRLRKMYESYTEFMKLMYPEDLKNPPIIPAKSGNYGKDTELGIKEYIFCIDGEEFMNYYEAARLIGITIESYMDLVEYYQANDTTEDGRELTMIDLSH